MPIVRDALAADLPIIAAAVAAQPLLVRYGTTAASLQRNLQAALEKKEDLIVLEQMADSAFHASPSPSPPTGLLGMAWFQRSGTLCLGGYLRLISLFPDNEGRGHGSLLLDEVERRTASESRNLFLLVSDFNVEARRFYKRRNYEEVGAMKSLVKSDIDEILMWKRVR